MEFSKRGTGKWLRFIYIFYMPRKFTRSFLTIGCFPGYRTHIHEVKWQGQHSLPNCPHLLEVIHQDIRVGCYITKSFRKRRASFFFLLKSTDWAKWNKFIKFETSQTVPFSSSANYPFTTTRSALTLGWVLGQGNHHKCSVTLRSDIYRKHEEKSAKGKPRKSRHAFHFMLFLFFFFRPSVTRLCLSVRCFFVFDAWYWTKYGFISGPIFM